jgi:hypothetical protein
LREVAATACALAKENRLLPLFELARFIAPTVRVQEIGAAHLTADSRSSFVLSFELRTKRDQIGTNHYKAARAMCSVERWRLSLRGPRHFLSDSNSNSPTRPSVLLCQVPAEARAAGQLGDLKRTDERRLQQTARWAQRTFTNLPIVGVFSFGVRMRSSCCVQV